MNYENQNPAAYAQPRAVIDLSLQARATFLTKVYSHLFGALVAFALIEIALFQIGAAESIATALIGSGSGMRWLLVLGGFAIFGNMASGVAHRATTLSSQYLALGAYVVLEALIFVPLLYVAEAYSGGGVIATAGFVSLAGFAGLSAVGIFSRRDFSFLGGLLKWGGVVAILLIVGGVLFGFHLGLFFSIAMVALAGGSILYSTQRILHEYPEDRYVGASLNLFAAVAMLFWYVLRIFMSRD